MSFRKCMKGYFSALNKNERMKMKIIRPSSRLVINNEVSQVSSSVLILHDDEIVKQF
jgi:hypothetical protein